MEKMMFNAHERELLPMDFPPVNYELLHKPYIPEPVLEPWFPVESLSSGPSQAEPSHAEPCMSSLIFIVLPTKMSFTTLMGLEDSHESSDSGVKKLSKAVEAIADEAGIGQLLHEPIKELWYHRLKR